MGVFNGKNVGDLAFVVIVRQQSRAVSLFCIIRSFLNSLEASLFLHHNKTIFYG
jgi:hypothetical protein